MAQTKQGAIKIAAKRIGVSVKRYKAQVAAGKKWCHVCRAWRPLHDFNDDRSRGDGKSARCRPCGNKYKRTRYKPKPALAPGRSFVPARDGDKKQARGRVNHFVKMGLLQHPNDLPCFDCGHVWKPGERRHEYDHYLGYAAEHHEHVQAVCSLCHAARTKARKPKNRTRDSMGRYSKES